MKLTKRLAAFALAAILLVSLLAIPAFADDGTQKTGWELHQIINLCIFGGIVVIAAILCIIFREKLVKKFRVYKSEAKKVVWLSWAETKKNTWVVLIVMLACAALICILDMVLSKGLVGIIGLIQK